MDLKLITKNTLEHEQPFPQLGSSTEYFGEQSNDLQFNHINDLDTVEGLNKLKQDINKILMTARGSNIFFELYGSDLQTMIGNKVKFDVISAKIRDEVIGALQVLQFVNIENPNLDEQLDMLQFLEIEQIEMGKFEVKISVTTISGKSIVTKFIITR